MAQVGMVYLFFYTISILLGLPFLAWRKAKLVSNWSLFVEAPLSGFLIIQVSLMLLNALEHLTRSTSWYVLEGLFAFSLLMSFHRLRRLTWQIEFSKATPYLLVVICLGALLRINVSNFLFHTGDQGYYVNAANFLARTGEPLTEGFLHLFTEVLAFSNFRWGSMGTTYIVAFIGMMTAATALATLAELGVRATALFFMAIAAFLTDIPVWFSKFPLSESLYALQFVGLVYFATLAYKTNSRIYFVWIAFSSLTLGLTRGNFFLTFFFWIIALIFMAITSKDKLRIQQSYGMVVALACGIFPAYLYNITHNRRVFVSTYVGFHASGYQDALASLGLLDVTATLFAVFAAGLIASYLLYRLLRDVISDRMPLSVKLWLQRLTWASLVAIVAYRFQDSVIHFLVYTPRSVVAIGLFSLALPLFAKSAKLRNDIYLICGLICLPFLLVYMSSDPDRRYHSHYLYYYRYLYAEVFWPFVIMAAIGFHYFTTWLDRYKSEKVRYGLYAALALFAIYEFDIVRPYFGQEILAGSHDYFTWIHAKLEKCEGPKLFAGFTREPNTKPYAWYFPNTYRAFALPLQETFGDEFVNLEPYLNAPFGPDPAPTAKDIYTFLHARQEDKACVLLVDGQIGGSYNWQEGELAGKLEIEQIGSDIYPATNRRQLTGNRRDVFYQMIFNARIYQITLHEERVAVSPPSASQH